MSFYSFIFLMGRHKQKHNSSVSITLMFMAGGAVAGGRAHVYFVALIHFVLLGHVNIGEDTLHNLERKRQS
jgi:hypothetical protein